MHDVGDFAFADCLASDGNSTVQVTGPINGDIYFHRYDHDNYGESNADCKRLPRQWSQSLRTTVAGSFRRTRRIRTRERPLGRRLSAIYGRREPMRATLCRSRYGIVRTSPAPHPDWKTYGQRGSAQLGRGAIPAAVPVDRRRLQLDTPSVVKAKYRGSGPVVGNARKCIDDAGASTNNGSAIQISRVMDELAELDVEQWRRDLAVLGKCMDVTGGGTANGTQVQLWDCNGTGSQEWRWRNQNRLVNPQSGRCLDVTGGERRRRHATPDLGLQRHRGPDLVPAVDDVTSLE